MRGPMMTDGAAGRAIVLSACPPAHERGVNRIGHPLPTRTHSADDGASLG